MGVFMVKEEKHSDQPCPDCDQNPDRLVCICKTFREKGICEHVLAVRVFRGGRQYPYPARRVNIRTAPPLLLPLFCLSTESLCFSCCRAKFLRRERARRTAERGEGGAVRCCSLVSDFVIAAPPGTLRF